MSSFGEGISTLTSAIFASGVHPPLVGSSRPSASTTPLPPSSQVFQPSTPSNVVDPSIGVVTGIPLLM